MKLASELHKRSTGKSFYILDEPTTGLHTEDISRLIKVLERFVDDGNTVLVIEHNLDVKTADHIIDLDQKAVSVVEPLLRPERQKKWRPILLATQDNI